VRLKVGLGWGRGIDVLDGNKEPNRAVGGIEAEGHTGWIVEVNDCVP
jgi:hypothetical protein